MTIDNVATHATDTNVDKPNVGAHTAPDVPDSTATQRFLNLPEGKRARIEQAAIAEFAARGYEAANTNRIATQAGISVGALFAYFETKDDLFTYLSGLGADLIERAVKEHLDANHSVMESIESILRLTVMTSMNDRQSVHLYQVVTSPGQRERSQKVAMQLERFSRDTYVDLLRKGQETGEIRDDVEPEFLAFHLDNTFVMTQYAFASDYFEERLRMYTGVDAKHEQSLEKFVDIGMKYLKSALAAPVS